MKKTNKTQLALQWYDTLTPTQQKKAFQQLIEYAIDSEWINIHDPETQAELAEETGKPITHYAAPYYTTCGEPLAK
jgi:hypothetical protein